MAKEKRKVKRWFKILNIVSIVAAIFMVQLSVGASREIDEINTIKRNEYIDANNDIDNIVGDTMHGIVLEEKFVLKTTLWDRITFMFVSADKNIMIMKDPLSEVRHTISEEEKIRLERIIYELNREIDAKNKVIEDKSLLKAIYDVIAVIGVIVGAILGLIQLLQFLGILPDKISLKITKA